MGNYKSHLRKNNRIKSIYSSLKIEANSLSDKILDDIPCSRYQDGYGYDGLSKMCKL